MIGIYRQFSQGLSVAGCAVMSAVTLGYMMNDCYNMEKRQIKSTYEKQIKVLNEEIEQLKYERTLVKVDKLKLK